MAPSHLHRRKGSGREGRAPSQSRSRSRRAGTRSRLSTLTRPTHFTLTQSPAASLGGRQSSRPDPVPAGTPTVGSMGTGSREHAHLSGARQGLPGAAASRPAAPLNRPQHLQGAGPDGGGVGGGEGGNS